MNKSLKKTALIALTTFIIALIVMISILLFAYKNKPDMNTASSDRNINYNKILPAKEIKNISLMVVNEDLIVKRNKGTDVKINFIAKLSPNSPITNPLIISQQNTELQVKMEHPSNIFPSTPIYIETAVLTISIPEQYSASLNIKSNSGDINLYDAGGIYDLSIESVSGDVLCKNINEKKANITARSVSGDLQLYFSQPFKTLNMKTVSGNANLYLSQMFELLNINSVSGDVNIYLPKRCPIFIRQLLYIRFN